MRVALALVLLSSGCIGALDPFDPEVGEPIAQRCDDADSDPDVEVSFSKDIAPIIRGEAGPGCGCHLPSNPRPIGLEQSGLDLSTISGLRAGGNRSRGVAVVAGQPCASVIMLKIGPAPPVGSRMPFNGPPFLGDREIQLIHDWIAEGAREN